MKIIILTSLVLLGAVLGSFEYRNAEVIRPSVNNKYRTEDVFDLNKKDNTFSFFPYLDEFVTYAGWYRKADKGKSEEEHLKEQINTLKTNLFGDNKVDLEKMMKNKEVFDDKWLQKQLKIARIMEIEDILAKEKEVAKK